MSVTVVRLPVTPPDQRGFGEEWLPVVGYEGFYEVSDRGRVWSVGRHVFLLAKPEPNHSMGYLRVHLSKGGKKSWHRLHTVVLRAFEGDRPAGLEARHLNGVVSDCSRANLTWGTHQQNIADKFRHGTDHNSSKVRCKRDHEFTPENTYINPRGFRQCRQCVRDARGVKNPRRVRSAA